MKKLVEHYCELPQPLRKPLWKVLHYLLQQFDRRQSCVFLNYGYASKNGTFKKLDIKSGDLSNRYGIQLYHYVTQDESFNNVVVLEVGCGRGGGAAWLTQKQEVKKYFGMDISKSAIAFCKKTHQIPGLSFIRGEAENIPFPNEYFDSVINIESARCYGDIGVFFNEVYRVLKPGGSFYFADMIKKPDVGKMDHLLLATNFNIIQRENITENIVLALQQDSISRKNIIDQSIPSFLRTAFYEFAGVEGSKRFNIFFNDDMQYWRFTLQKQ